MTVIMQQVVIGMVNAIKIYMILGGQYEQFR